MSKRNHQEIERVEPSKMFKASSTDDIPLVLSYDVDRYTTVDLPTTEDGVYDYSVDWGDGSKPERDVSEHKFETAGLFQITITGKFHGIAFDRKQGRQCLTSIAWGSRSKIAPSAGYQFEGCRKLVGFTGTPDLSGLTDMSSMFCGATSFNDDIDHWDVSAVEDMSQMFSNASSFDKSLSSWNVGKVTEMCEMFECATSFNDDLNKWDVSAVTIMDGLFRDATAFNGDISNWETSKVTDMGSMFRNAKQFSGDLKNWDTSKVTDMSHMFDGAKSFNSCIINWNVSNLESMNGMFDDADAFERVLETLDVFEIAEIISNTLPKAIDMYDGMVTRSTSKAFSKAINKFEGMVTGSI